MPRDGMSRTCHDVYSTLIQINNNNNNTLCYRFTISTKTIKMVAEKKTKKTLESINSRLALVMKSGKYSFGYKQTLKSLRLVCRYEYESSIIL